jgi:hypothetical protein
MASSLVKTNGDTTQTQTVSVPSSIPTPHNTTQSQNATASSSLPAPELYWPKDGETTYGHALLTWSEVKDAAYYIVQTRSDRLGQTDWKEWGKTYVERFDLIFDANSNYFRDPGTIYYWRVIAVNSQNERGTPSGTRKFIFQRKPHETGTALLQSEPTVHAGLDLFFIIFVCFGSGISSVILIFSKFRALIVKNESD